MGQNTSSAVRTCHIDTTYHFIRENLGYRIIKITFVMSADNDSDIVTNSVSPVIYKRYVKKILRRVMCGLW
jgi:hypothetical protein